MWLVVRDAENQRMYAAQPDGGAVYETMIRDRAKTFESAADAYAWAANFGIFQGFKVVRNH